ncbi:hypothetical protein [Pelistega indica]|uniref:hypothetical protein n=1 Tax=Pelistega indica TaxID=1414851 RepID=UPI0003FEB1BD|nr:hypothetical protein [Pelistega indica]
MFKFKLISFILFSILVNQSYADNPADKGCKTTDECLAQVAKAGIASLKNNDFTSENDKKEDQFYWLQKINKASAVMLKEEKIISSELAKKLAEGIVYTNEQSIQPNGKRPKDVLQIEKIIQDKIGPDASFIPYWT